MKMKLLWGVATVVLAGLIGAGAYLYLARQSSALQEVAEQSTFPIYEPTYLPSGYTVDDTTISRTEQVLLFAAESSDGEAISFTQQPTPPSFDFDEFYKQRYVGLQDADSIYGRGRVGIIDGNMGGSLATESTWVIVNGPRDLPANEMKDIVGGLKPL